MEPIILSGKKGREPMKRKNLFTIAIPVITVAVFMLGAYGLYVFRRGLTPPDNLPPYMKTIYGTLRRQGVKIVYTPKITVPDLQKVSDPYKPPFRRNIPANWITTEFRMKSRFGPIEFFNANYVVLYKFDPVVKRNVIAIYKKKNPNSPIPKHLSLSDYELVKTLDKASNGGANMDLRFSDDFKYIAWLAGSDKNNTKLTEWVYDVPHNKIIKVFSFENKIDNISEGFSTANSKFLVLNFDYYNPSHEGKDRNLTDKYIVYLIIYDIEKEKPIFTLKSSKFFYDYSALINNYLYVSKLSVHDFLSRDSNFIGNDIVRIDIRTKKEKTIIPKIANTSIDITNNIGSKFLLIPHQKNYLFFDIWLFDTKANTLTCNLRVKTETDTSAYVFPSLTDKGIMCYSLPNNPPVNGGTNELDWFYNWKLKKLYYTGIGCFRIRKKPAILECPKWIEDVMNLQPPIVDYGGKKDREKGYITWLLVCPP